MDESKLPAVVTRAQLSGLEAGRPCETCGSSMVAHEWVLMDSEGFVVFCSKMRFEGIEGRDFFSKVWYRDEEKYESPQEFAHGRMGGSSLSNEEFVSRIIDSYRQEIELDEVRGVHVYSYGKAVYHVDECAHAELGDDFHEFIP